MPAIYCTKGHFIESTDPKRTPAKFCGACGAESVPKCPQCDASIPIETPAPKFCKNCGKPFPWTNVK
jgi:hypothetical protein